MVIGAEIQKTVVMLTKFSQANDKIFYNLNEITSLPIGHLYLKDLTSYKEKIGEKFEKYFLKEKNKKLEREAFLKCSRLSIYNQILSQNFEY